VRLQHSPQRLQRQSGRQWRWWSDDRDSNDMFSGGSKVFFERLRSVLPGGMLAALTMPQRVV
jgi:hypothetical protein